MTTKNTTVVLELYAAFRSAGRDKMVRVGTMFHTEKGKTMINIESTPTKIGDWDGKSYLAMKPDNSDLTDIFPVRKSASGSVLPVFEAKAVFETVEGRGNRTNYILCGVGFLGRVRDDDTVRSIVVTLSSKPTGDTGDWDGWTYVGFPLDIAQEKKTNSSAGKSRKGKTAESEASELEAS